MPTEHSKAASRSNRYRSARLLLVDSDTDLSRQVSSHLTCLGFSVETARYAQEALSLFRTGRFPFVLIDPNSPDMNCGELFQKIRLVDRHVSVVIIRGHEGSCSLAIPRCDIGSCQLIEKPIAPEKLGLIVGRAVEQNRLARKATFFRRLSMALVVSIPFWVGIGALLALRYLRG